VFQVPPAVPNLVPKLPTGFIELFRQSYEKLLELLYIKLSFRRGPCSKMLEVKKKQKKQKKNKKQKKLFRLGGVPISRKFRN